MLVTITDGGRAATNGYKGTGKDCVVRAIAIAMDIPYAEVYDRLIKRMKSGDPYLDYAIEKTGIKKRIYVDIIESLGWKFTPTMGIGTGCKVHLRADELPSGRLIVKVSRHLVAVIDGVIHDNHDCTRNGTRCVYGYWKAA